MAYALKNLESYFDSPLAVDLQPRTCMMYVPTTEHKANRSELLMASPMTVFNMNAHLCKRDISLYLNVRARQHTYGHILSTSVCTQVRHNLSRQQSQVRLDPTIDWSMGLTSSNSRICLSVAAFTPQSGGELQGAVDACLKVQRPETQIVLFKPSLLSRIRKPSITHFFSAIGRSIELRRGEKVGPFASVGTTIKRLPCSHKLNATVITEARYWHSCGMPQ